jgi:hypothetical protein
MIPDRISLLRDLETAHTAIKNEKAAAVFGVLMVEANFPKTLL